MANVLYRTAMLVGTQTDETPGNTNADVLASVQVYTSDIEGTPDYTDAQGIKIIDGTLGGSAVRRRSLIGETVNDGSGSADLEHKLTLEGPETLTFQTRLNGSGHDTPIADGDFDLPPAIRFLFEGLGVVKTSGSATESIYNGGQPTYLTLSWLTGDDANLIRYRYGSCLVQSVAISFVPGEAALATWTVMVGHLNNRVEGGVFPPFPDPSPPVNTVAGYGKMDTLPAAPFVQAAMSIGGFARRPGEITLTITQGLERVGNGNNANNGIDIFPTNLRTVTLAGNVFLVDTDIGQEFDDMDLDLSVDDTVFTYGTAAANMLRFSLFNVVVDEFTPSPLGNQYAHVIASHATAVGSVGGSEIEIRST